MHMCGVCFLYVLTFIFQCLRGSFAHVTCTRNWLEPCWFTNNCLIASSLMLVIRRLCFLRVMRSPQRQQLCPCQAMQMKSEEPHVKFGVGHENNLQIHATCWHACWCVWICEVWHFGGTSKIKSINVQLPCILNGRVLVMGGENQRKCFNKNEWESLGVLFKKDECYKWCGWVRKQKTSGLAWAWSTHDNMFQHDRKPMLNCFHIT